MAWNIRWWSNVLVGKVAAAAPTTLPDGKEQKRKNDKEYNTVKADRHDNDEEPVPLVGKKGKTVRRRMKGSVMIHRVERKQGGTQQILKLKQLRRIYRTSKRNSSLSLVKPTT